LSFAKYGWNETNPKKNAPATFTKNSEYIPAIAEPRVTSNPLPIRYLASEPNPPPIKTKTNSERIGEDPRDGVSREDKDLLLYWLAVLFT
jgi:hypothetical protein